MEKSISGIATTVDTLESNLTSIGLEVQVRRKEKVGQFLMVRFVLYLTHGGFSPQRMTDMAEAASDDAQEAVAFKACGKY